jgi:DNA helicase HerA-like ATPase
MNAPLLIAKGEKDFVSFHVWQTATINGGATGTGKTVTLQVIAENFSLAGIPVFMADVKGDLSGISKPGKPNDKLAQRLKKLKIDNHTFQGFPVVFWDLFGKSGHPIRTTVTDMGPLLLSRILNLMRHKPEGSM